MNKCYFRNCQRKPKYTHAGMELCSYHWKPKNFMAEKTREAGIAKNLIEQVKEQG